MRFRTWIRSKERDSSPTGELARFVSKDRFRDLNTLVMLLYLDGYASDESTWALVSACRAWREYCDRLGEGKL